VHYLQSNIRFIGDTPTAHSHKNEYETLQQLRRAVLDRTTIRFLYHTRHRHDEQSNALLREADPYGLAHFNNGWHLVAYCHLREDLRNFRLDRMEELELLPRTFTRPAHFQLHQRPQDQPKTLLVRVLFDKEIARWVREARQYFVTSEEDTEDGLLVTMMIRQPDEVLRWLLSWGRHVRVLEPKTLRDQLAEEAQTMVQHYQK
jgi:predicted DNA-binding transcriptional regulator YafY